MRRITTDKFRLREYHMEMFMVEISSDISSSAIYKNNLTEAINLAKSEKEKGKKVAIWELKYEFE